MKGLIVVMLSVFLMVVAPVSYAANSGVSNNLTGDPGNSLAAHGGYLDSGGDPNCIGDIQSRTARDIGGLGQIITLGEPGQITEILSGMVTLASVVWLVFDKDCSEGPFPPPP